MKSELYGTIFLAGGCFWGMEKLFSAIDGVTETQVGFANGKEELSPTYKEVCQGDTGFKETVKVTFDDKRVSLEKLLFAFFCVIDVNTPNRQGHDIGEQYQAGVFFTTESQKETAVRVFSLEKENESGFCVLLESIVNFVPAEEFHQKYLVKNKNGYCHITQDLHEKVLSALEKDFIYDKQAKAILKSLQ